MALPSRLLPLRNFVLLALAVVAMVALVRPVEAQTASPSISPAGIEVESPVPAGEETDLPSLGVRNEGKTALRFRMEARFDDAASAEAAGWVRFEPQEFELPAGEGREVKVRLDVPEIERPADEASAAYRLLLSASVLPEGDGESVNVAVAAAVASILEFEVGAPVADSASYNRYLVAGLLGVVTMLAGMGGFKAMELLGGLHVDVSVRRKGSSVEGADGAPEARSHQSEEGGSDRTD